MLYQVVEDGQITESYSMPDHDDTHHITTAKRNGANGVAGLDGNNALHNELHKLTTLTGNTTLTASHFTVLVNAVGSAKTITLPAAASHAHRIYNIKKIDASANTVTIDANGAETIDDALTVVIASQWDSYTIQCNGTGWFIV